MVQTKPLATFLDLYGINTAEEKYLEIPPSNALLLSRSIVASRLIVKCGVPSEGENVYWLGISKLTITSQSML